MNNFHSSQRISQRGSALFMILIAVALFAALSYAVSQQRESGVALSTEKIRLYAGDVLDMGNKMADTVGQMRLRKIQNTQLSFENTIVTGYTNTTCLTDMCKVFAYNGGGRDWETPVADINKGADWSYTGDIAVQNIGTTNPDLVALLPMVTLTICNRINSLIGITGASGPPPEFTGVIANKFTGVYAAAPFDMADPVIQGQKSACVSLKASSGTALSALVGSAGYVYYHVLDAR